MTVSQNLQFEDCLNAKENTRFGNNCLFDLLFTVDRYLQWFTLGVTQGNCPAVQLMSFVDFQVSRLKKAAPPAGFAPHELLSKGPAATDLPDPALQLLTHF